MLNSLFIILILILSNLSAAEFISEDVNGTKKQPSWIALPYVFSSQSTGLTGGVIGIFNGYIQPQTTIVITAFGGESVDVKKYDETKGVLAPAQKANTQGLFLGISGYRVPFSKRLFLSAMGSYAYYPNQRLYVDGSNDSKRDLSLDTPSLTPIQTHGYNNWGSVDVRYVLPWGESKEKVLPVVKLKNGLPVNRQKSGGGMPFITGQTLVGVEYFYKHMRIDQIENKPALSSNGLRLYMQHDNTDYSNNPSKGYKFELKGSFDFGLGDSTQSWNALEGSYSHFIQTENFSWSRNNVLALNFWSAYSPSWENKDDTKILKRHRPPMWEGAHLGGWTRLRAYDSSRFSDKAAIYGAAEYRVIPKLNPLRGKKWNPFPIDWFQTVLFVEAGRVNPRYNVAELLSDMKYDVGFSLRALAAKVPVRFEMAFGQEGSSMWVMVKQPF